jgi:hypothetical protein
MPSVLAAVLLCLLVGQALMPTEPKLPETRLPIGRALQPPMPAMPAAPSASAILERPLFAPRQNLLKGTEGGKASPLGEATIAGSLVIRGRAAAVVRRANGQVFYLPIGGSIAGWRLIRLDAASASFRKGSETAELAFGAAATVQGTTDNDDSSADE